MHSVEPSVLINSALMSLMDLTVSVPSIVCRIATMTNDQPLVGFVTTSESRP